jgi:acetyl-CoA carboxylase carboxyltransferase component
MHELIDCIVDDKYFFEIKPNYTKNMVTGFAKLNGMLVGIIANNPTFLAGAIDWDDVDC